MVVALLKMSKKKKALAFSYSDIAREVTKVGGGNPTKQAISDLAAAVAADPAW